MSVIHPKTTTTTKNENIHPQIFNKSVAVSNMVAVDTINILTLSLASSLSHSVYVRCDKISLFACLFVFVPILIEIRDGKVYSVCANKIDELIYNVIIIYSNVYRCGPDRVGRNWLLLLLLLLSSFSHSSEVNLIHLNLINIDLS